MNTAQNPVADVGWVGYANFYPVSYNLSCYLDDARISWWEGVPCGLNHALQQARVQVALTSSINVWHNKSCQPFIDYGVSCKGAVDSVYLGMKSEPPALKHHLEQAQEFLRLSKKNLTISDIRRQSFSRLYEGPVPELSLGRVSASSAALALIFYRLWFGSKANHLRWSHHSSQNTKHSLSSLKKTPIKEGVFYLMIGDEALRRKKEFSLMVDLSEVWYALTKLPFVFALWQHIPDVISNTKSNQKKIAVIKDCIMRATQNSSQVIAKFASQSSSSTSKVQRPQRPYLDANISVCFDLHHYWQKMISYPLGPREYESLELYFSLVKEIH